MLNQQQSTSFIASTQTGILKNDPLKRDLTKVLVLIKRYLVHLPQLTPRYHSTGTHSSRDSLMNYHPTRNLKSIWSSNLMAAADDCRVIITKLQLIVPRLSFNSEGQKLYMSEYLDNRKWTYLRENIEACNRTQQRTGTFRIPTGITRPRHVFVFIINDANMHAQIANPFPYNTFSVSTGPRTFTLCDLKVGNGNEYPEQHYKPSTEPTRVYRDVLKFRHGNYEYSDGTRLNRTNFEHLPICLLRSHKTKIRYQGWDNQGSRSQSFKRSRPANSAKRWHFGHQ